ncbi:carbonic anhydrase [Bacillaceae bacterium]
MFFQDLFQSNGQWGKRENSVAEKTLAHKKMLFVLGMEEELERSLLSAANMHLERIFVLKCFGPVISQPFGDVMRAIILAVYEENVGNIFIVGAEDGESTVLRQSFPNQIFENEEMAKKVQTLEYLFQHCRSEFPPGDLKEWLKGSRTVADGIKQSIRMIRQNPLIPSCVQVDGFLLNMKSGRFTALDG